MNRERLVLYGIVAVVFVVMALAAMLWGRGAIARRVCADPVGILSRAELVITDCGSPR